MVSPAFPPERGVPHFYADRGVRFRSYMSHVSPRDDIALVRRRQGLGVDIRGERKAAVPRNRLPQRGLELRAIRARFQRRSVGPSAGGAPGGFHPPGADYGIRRELQIDGHRQDRAPRARPGIASQENRRRLPEADRLDRVLPLRPAPREPLRGRRRKPGVLRLRHDGRAIEQRPFRLSQVLHSALRRRSRRRGHGTRRKRKDAGGRGGGGRGLGQGRGSPRGGEARAVLHEDVQGQSAGEEGQEREGGGRGGPADAHGERRIPIPEHVHVHLPILRFYRRHRERSERQVRYRQARAAVH